MSVKIDKGFALDNLTMTPLIDVVFNLLIFFLVAPDSPRRNASWTSCCPRPARPDP